MDIYILIVIFYWLYAGDWTVRIAGLERGDWACGGGRRRKGRRNGEISSHIQSVHHSRVYRWVQKTVPPFCAGMGGLLCCCACLANLLCEYSTSAAVYGKPTLHSVAM